MEQDTTYHPYQCVYPSDDPDTPPWFSELLAQGKLAEVDMGVRHQVASLEGKKKTQRKRRHLKRLQEAKKENNKKKQPVQTNLDWITRKLKGIRLDT